MKPGTIPLHIQAPLRAPINRRRITDGITAEILETKDSSIYFQESLYTPIPIPAAIPAEIRSVNWLAPERVLTPNETTENDSIVISAIKGIIDSQIDGVGIFSLEMLLFILFFLSHVIKNRLFEYFTKLCV